MRPAPAPPCVFILNAGLNGRAGNTAALLRRAQEALAPHVEVAERELTSGLRYADMRTELACADGFVLGTGTHWDSWSSLLQRWLEEATADEGSSLWLGKPAAVIVTMHSVGGKAVLSRLQGVLNTFGCLIPPMSGMVYSAVNQAALAAAEAGGAAAANDIWAPEDVGIVCHNLLVALGRQKNYTAWPTDRTDYRARWVAEN